MRTLCEKCLEDAVEKTATETRWGTPLCESCATSEDEAAYERSLSPGVTIAELTDRAHRERSAGRD